jgi:4a-hydroxytetrahydrobiopterin dehydratase
LGGANLVIIFRVEGILKNKNEGEDRKGEKKDCGNTPGNPSPPSLREGGWDLFLRLGKDGRNWGRLEGWLNAAGRAGPEHSLRLSAESSARKSGEERLIQAWVRLNLRHIAVMAVKLTGHQIEVVLSTLDGWKQESGQIAKEFQFSDFIAASMFVTGVNLEAEKANHHPELFHRYQKVKIQLSTHDVGGISELDLRMAKKLDARAKSLQAGG